MRRRTATISILVCILIVAATYSDISLIRQFIDGAENTSRCPIKSNTMIVIYEGSLSNYNESWHVGGVDPLSYDWITFFFDWWQSHGSTIKHVFLNSTNLRSDCRLSDYHNLKLYIQPGGDAFDQQTALGPAGKSNILDFLGKGGSYIGICAGWYYAATDYYWMGTLYKWSDLLGKYPTVEGPISSIAEYPAYNVTRMSNGLKMIYYGGPTRGWQQTPHDTPGKVLLTYASMPSNLPAAVAAGQMLFLGVHPEAYENWGVSGLTTEQRIANYNWLANQISNLLDSTLHYTQTTFSSSFAPTLIRNPSGSMQSSSAFARTRMLPIRLLMQIPDEPIQMQTMRRARIHMKTT